MYNVFTHAAVTANSIAKGGCNVNQGRILLFGNITRVTGKLGCEVQLNEPKVKNIFLKTSIRSRIYTLSPQKV